jgi:uncharacterized protein YabN with tetrapyrrole methylase and pyrophosphatase domain
MSAKRQPSRPARRDAGTTPGGTAAVPLGETTAAAVVTKGSLVVIGTGIRTVGQLTIEAIAWMREADALLYVVGDPIAEQVMRNINPDRAVSMAGYYKEGQERINAYHAMVDHVLRSVRAGAMTVAAFYGHPGVFAYPSHESIRRARQEGYAARMLPGISAEDCLFADLGVDPAVGGCQSYEASDFMMNAPVIDTSSQLVLWQIGTVGDWTYKRYQYDTKAMPLLVQRLLQFYPPSHPVTVYEAPMFPNVEPMMSQIPLYSLGQFPITAAKTLYIPPCRPRFVDSTMQHLYATQVR